MRSLLTGSLVLLLLATPLAGAEPPEQAPSGPGGSDYPHGSRLTRVIDGFSRYMIVEPVWPRPESAPVLLFLAGVTGSGPYLGATEYNVFAAAYEPMFRHLAGKGYVVIFPAYGIAGTLPGRYEENAAQAARRALQRLSTPWHISPAPGQFAVGGHSFGALAARMIAHRAEDHGLPQPRVIIGHEPGLVSLIQELCDEEPGNSLCDLDLPPAFDGIPPATIHVTIVGGADRLDHIESTIAEANLAQIPDELEQLLFINDDRNGDQWFTVTHLSSGAHPSLPIPGFELNLIDWYGYWKPTVAALDFGFRGQNRRYVLESGPGARFMGTWSDGTPVAPMSTAEDFE